MPKGVLKASKNTSARTGWGFINVQGLQNKVHEIEELLRTQRLAVLGLAETWLLPGEELRVEGFRWVGLARAGQVGRGGVGVFIEKDWTVVDETSFSSKGVESLWVTVSGKSMANILIGVVYFTPHGGRDVLDKGTKIVDFILEKQRAGAEVVVMGDFNAHFDEAGVALDNRASFVVNLSGVAGLSIMNWQPGVTGKWTWACGGKQSVLDYVLLSERCVEEIERFVIDDDGLLDIGSDHNLMFWYTGKGEEPSRPKVKRQVRKGWRWKVGGKVDWDKYRRSIEDRMDSFAVDMMSTPASGWTARGRYKVFMSYLTEAADSSLGKTFLGGKRRENKGWWDEEVKAAVKQRREASRAHRLYKKLAGSFPGVVSEDVVKKKWEEYLLLKQVAKDMVRNKMRKEREDILEEMRSAGGYNSRAFWQRAKGKQCKGLSELQNENGEIEQEETVIASIARDYFEKLGKGCWDSSESCNGEAFERFDFRVREVEAGAKLQLESALTYEEVVKAIKGMKKGKGVGGDKVSAEMLLEGGEILWHNLHALLQVCWEEEFIPGEWMEGIIVPLHKEGNERDLGNYRGITLGSHIGKVFCSVLRERLCRAVDGVVLEEAQGGFRKNRQTVDHLFVVNGICQLRRGRVRKPG